MTTTLPRPGFTFSPPCPELLDGLARDFETARAAHRRDVANVNARHAYRKASEAFEYALMLDARNDWRGYQVVPSGRKAGILSPISGLGECP